ncbi:LacI family DNA-binding transcriptional regulator [Actinomyces procaprae]|uniref:LacI family DNA-binding transcriptional regulator n=1 Tax=Actinomyces procaprae TaxID=2560010 RepID=UPI00109DA2CB|nr:LacI family DNA-binding transcriptional regulator [Actinomyces procaprae]
MATIADVARVAKVSVSTASRALRDSPQISEATRRRVKEAARELDYVVNTSARRLASGRTDAVGLLVPYVTGWFFGQAITGAEQVLRAAGCDVLLYNLVDVAGRRSFFERMPLRNVVGGALIFSLALSQEEIRQFTRYRIALTTLGEATAQVSSVMIDDRAAATTAVRHLLNLGHRRIGLISGELDHPMGFKSSRLRHQGYRDALAQAGIAADPALVVEADYTVQGGCLAVARLMSLAEPPTAIFVMSDEMAIGAMQTARSMGIRVPEDLSVVGFDDYKMSELFGLTTIRQPVLAEGRSGAELLLSALGEGADAPVHNVLPTELVVRATTMRLEPRPWSAP